MRPFFYNIDFFSFSSTVILAVFQLAVQAFVKLLISEVYL